MKRILATLALSALAAGAGIAPALAGSASSTMTTSATVVNDCTIGSASMPALNYDPAQGTGLTVTGSISITCTNGATATVALDFGQNPNGTTNRQMFDATVSGYLPYNVYQDSAYGTLWGSTSGVNTLAVTGTGSSQSVPVYLKANPTVGAKAGSYTDTIGVTVTF